MTEKITIIKRDGREIVYEPSVINKERGFIVVYQLGDDGRCTELLAAFDPCDLKSVYIG